jgi:hypothetical protein
MPFLLGQDKSDAWSCRKRHDGLAVSHLAKIHDLDGVVIIAAAPSLHAACRDLLNAGMRSMLIPA